MGGRSSGTCFRDVAIGGLGVGRCSFGALAGISSVVGMASSSTSRWGLGLRDLEFPVDRLGDGDSVGDFHPGSGFRKEVWRGRRESPFFEPEVLCVHQRGRLYAQEFLEYGSDVVERDVAECVAVSSLYVKFPHMPEHLEKSGL